MGDEHPEFPAVNSIDRVKFVHGQWFTDEPTKLPQTILFELANGETRTINRAMLNPGSSDWRHASVKDDICFGE